MVCEEIRIAGIRRSFNVCWRPRIQLRTMIAVSFRALLNTHSRLMPAPGTAVMHNNARQRMQLRRGLIVCRVGWCGRQTCRVFLGPLRNFSRGCIRGTREMREIYEENSEMRETQRACDQIFDEITLRGVSSEIYVSGLERFKLPCCRSN